MTGLLNVKDKNGRSVYEMASHEREPISFDFTADLGVGETIASSISVLVHRATEIEEPGALDGLPIPNVAFPAATILTQWVKDPPKDAEGYRLTMRATTTTGRIVEPELEIEVRR